MLDSPETNLEIKRNATALNYIDGAALTLRGFEVRAWTGTQRGVNGLVFGVAVVVGVASAWDLFCKVYLMHSSSARLVSYLFAIAVYGFIL